VTGALRGSPRVAVVLPVRDGEKYLSAAVESVLGQTFGDFELVVVDDGSTDRTMEILAGFSDTRLRVIRLAGKLGLVAALNRGILDAGGEFVARMDADDVCHPRRFEKQVDFLEAHSGVSACGTWFRTFGARKSKVRTPLAPEHIRARLFFGWAVGHPTLMIRRAFLQSNGLYFDEEFTNCEDYDLMVRAAQLGQIETIPEFLLAYRLHDGQVSASHQGDMAEKADRIRLRQVRKLLGGLTEAEARLHGALAAGSAVEVDLPFAERWLLRLEKANRASCTYDVRCFREGLEEWWYRAHAAQARSARLEALRSYWKSSLRSPSAVSVHKHVRLAAKCLLPCNVAAWWRQS